MFTLKATEFIRPFGRKKPYFTEMDDEFKPFYEDMTAKGCEIQVEVLWTGEASLTVSNPSEMVDYDIELVENGPEVIEALKRLLKNKSWEDIED